MIPFPTLPLAKTQLLSMHNDSLNILRQLTPLPSRASFFGGTPIPCNKSRLFFFVWRGLVHDIVLRECVARRGPCHQSDHRSEVVASSLDLGMQQQGRGFMLGTGREGYMMRGGDGWVEGRERGEERGWVVRMFGCLSYHTIDRTSLQGRSLCSPQSTLRWAVALHLRNVAHEGYTHI